jgi:DNA-binding transcriptional MerR regulator
MGDLSIGELARRAGVRPSAVRYYEQAGLLPAPPRRSGRRCYGRSTLRRLGFIAEARRAGFGIKRVRSWLGAWDGGEGSRAVLRDFAAAELAEVDARLEALARLRVRLGQALDCPCPSLEDCGLF